MAKVDLGKIDEVVLALLSVNRRRDLTRFGPNAASKPDQPRHRFSAWGSGACAISV